jgi:CheY-like chemotaxis protein
LQRFERPIQNRLAMLVNLCPICRAVNPAYAKRCSDCGGDLDEWDTLTAPQALFPRAPVSQTAGALWLGASSAQTEGAAGAAIAGEEHAAEAPAADAALPVAPAPDAAPLELTLRDLGGAPQGTRPAGSSVRPEPPTLVDALPSGDAGLAPLRLNDALPGVSAEPCRDDAPLRAKVKSARRAAVRSKRMAGASRQDRGAATEPGVLVVDVDRMARQQLCALLLAFGFDVQAQESPSKASAIVETDELAAVFLDVALDGADGGAGIELCRRLRSAKRQQGAGGRPLMVLVAEKLHPVDRVRADLAGFDEVIVKPVTRSNVARALDLHGIAIPLDDRGS